MNKIAIKFFYYTYVWVSFAIMLSCSSNDEPKPIDCAQSDLSLNITPNDPTSCDANTGSITLAATGGKAPYQFAIDNQAYGTNANFTNLGAGTYQVKVKDSNGCENTKNATLNPFGSTLSATLASVGSGCKTANGSITINAAGGAPPYSYQLNNGQSTSNSTVNNLASGNYSVKVTDSKGCSTTQSVQVLTGVKYSADVKTIIENSCAISGCHVNGGAAPSSFTDFANVKASASEIKSRTQSGSMPKGLPKLPQSQLDAIACWVDDGAPNN